MTTFLNDARVAGALFVRLADHADEAWVASAWASDGSYVAAALWEARRRIASLVVGLDFHQTDPKFLRRFRPWARVHQTADGTFHPKVYLFRKGTRFDAIVGSSNLTRAGFGGNVEANMHVKGATSDDTFLKLKDFIEDLAIRGVQMHEADIDHYENEWRRARRDVERAKKFRPLATRQTRPGALSMHVDWRAFVRGMLQAVERKGHTIYPHGRDDLGYVGVITDVQRIFRRRRRLSRMSREERQKVAGLVNPYGYFGGMWGAGLFMHYVLDEPQILDAALDDIPAKPHTVTREHFDAFARAITRRKGLGRPAVGSRLLAMKRPDVFLCLDSANRIGLGNSFGLSPAYLYSYEGYWELMSLLWKCPWYTSPRPAGRERSIWNARVALVDAFFYEAE